MMVRTRCASAPLFKYTPFLSSQSALFHTIQRPISRPIFLSLSFPTFGPSRHLSSTTRVGSYRGLGKGFLRSSQYNFHSSSISAFSSSNSYLYPDSASASLRLKEQHVWYLAKKSIPSIHLADLVQFGPSPISTEDLLASANFALASIPVRLARRIVAFRKLPYIVFAGSLSHAKGSFRARTNANATRGDPGRLEEDSGVSVPVDMFSTDPAGMVAQAYQRYVLSLESLMPWLGKSLLLDCDNNGATLGRAESVHIRQGIPQIITSLEEETLFSEALATHLLDAHANTIGDLATGFSAARRRGYLSGEQTTTFMDHQMRSRIVLRLLAEQHVALHCAYVEDQEALAQRRAGENGSEELGVSSYVGVVDTRLRPAQVIHNCANLVGDICEFRYGIRPRIEIDTCAPAAKKDSNTTTSEKDARDHPPWLPADEIEYAYVPAHLEYIITEILKNAFRATIEYHQSSTKGINRADGKGMNSDLESKSLSSPSYFPVPPVVITIVVSTSRPVPASSSTEPFVKTRGRDGERQQQQTLSIRIRDRGGGIVTSMIPKIWEYSFSTFGEESITGGGRVDRNDIPSSYIGGGTTNSSSSSPTILTTTATTSNEGTREIGDSQLLTAFDDLISRPDSIGAGFSNIGGSIDFQISDVKSTSTAHPDPSTHTEIDTDTSSPSPSSTPLSTIMGSSIAGMGFGLPLARAYAKTFGGTIEIESMSGWGTDVYITLKGVIVDDDGGNDNGRTQSG